MGSHQQDKIVKVQKPYERMGERGKKQSDVSACSKAGRKNRNTRAGSDSGFRVSLFELEHYFVYLYPHWQD